MITYSEIASQFDYDSESGLIRRKTKKGLSLDEWPIVGSLRSDGYVVVAFTSKRLLVHRVAWVLMTGEWPMLFIDHKNGIKNDNRWLNLREANHSENAANSKLKSTNKSGFKGVSQKVNGKWIAQIKKNGKTRHIGTFDNPLDASLAYKAKASSTHKEFMKI